MIVWLKGLSKMTYLNIEKLVDFYLPDLLDLF